MMSEAKVPRKVRRVFESDSHSEEPPATEEMEYESDSESSSSEAPPVKAEEASDKGSRGRRTRKRGSSATSSSKSKRAKSVTIDPQVSDADKDSPKDTKQPKADKPKFQLPPRWLQVKYTDKSEKYVKITAAMTGGHAGARLVGIADDTKNVVLHLVDTVKAPKCMREAMEAAVGRDKLMAGIMHHYGMSRAQAELKYNDMPVDDDAANHRALGACCNHSIDHNCDCNPTATFMVLQPGVWQEYADRFGNGDKLRDLVQRKAPVDWRGILSLMKASTDSGSKTLILRTKLFAEQQGPCVVAENDLRLKSGANCVADAHVLCPNLESVLYDLHHVVVRVPTPAHDPFSREDVAPTVVKALHAYRNKLQERMEFDLCAESLQPCIASLSPLSAGALKSSMQKAVRFRSKTVTLTHNGLRVAIPTPVYASVVCAMLFADRGSFSPELQLYMRGCTAACKRTGVVIVEDSWVNDPSTPSKLEALFAMSLVMQKIPDYNAPLPFIQECLKLIALSAGSRFLCNWRHVKEKSTPRSEIQRTPFPVDEQGKRSLKMAAKLLRLVRSFEGDMQMMDTVASEGVKASRLTLLFRTKRQSAVDDHHAVDQHVFRGIGHAINGCGHTFKLRFSTIFNEVTGVNPRMHSVESFEQRSSVKAVRNAQKVIMYLARKREATGDEWKPLRVEEVQLKLDRGVLAAGVGPVHVKVGGKALIVLLGVQTPEDEVVMAKPSRVARELYSSLTDSQREKAISQVRDTSHQFSSPLFPAGRKHVASFCHESNQWELDGRPWIAEVQQTGIQCKVPIFAAPEWTRRLLEGGEGDHGSTSSILADDQVFNDALMLSRPKGFVERAKELVIALFLSIPLNICLRAVGMVRQQYFTVSMPTPSLSGSLSSDQLVAYEGDWDVYRLLAIASALVPGALKPEQVPRFRVVDAVLLRVVEQWMLEAVALHNSHGKSVAAGSAVSSSERSGAVSWANHSEWSSMKGIESKLMEHQRAAVERMEERDAERNVPGHFVVMDTGLGKTVTAVAYSYRWLCKQGEGVEYILWVTPDGTVENLVQQLREQWRVPIHQVPRVSAAKSLKADNTRRLSVCKYSVNVIHADHLRTVIDQMVHAATKMFIIFDEVDKMYAPSLRTSAARRLASLCPKFVAQTATPMGKNEAFLTNWLADTESYPVTTDNMLVAASGMVSMQLELNITAVEEDYAVPMVDEVRECYRSLGQSRNWMSMASTTQLHTDVLMCSKVKELVTQDRRRYPDGGVLMVADNLAHAKSLVSRMHVLGVKCGGFDVLSSHDTSYGCVVVTKDKDRGYNSAVRFGHIVTGVYAGNASSRHQMRGRIRRIGQVRSEVRFVTCFMKNSILELLHQRHQRVDTMNISLEALGRHFGAEIMAACLKSSEEGEEE